MTAKTYTLSPSACLFHADMRDALKALPDNSIDSVVCDPPYHLTSIVKRFGGENAVPAQFGTDGLFQRSSRGMMGKVWDGGDIAFQVDTWREVYRVLKPGAYVAAFGAPRNFGRLQCAILDAGFEERDTILNIVDPNDAVVQFLQSLSETQVEAFLRCLAQSEMSGFLAWTFGVGFPKSHDVSKGIDKAAGAEREVVGFDAVKAAQQTTKQGTSSYGDYVGSSGAVTAPATPEALEWQGWGTALKPAFEPIVLARKPLSESTVAANVLKWRTGAINIAACRVGTEGGTKRGEQGERLKDDKQGFRANSIINALDAGRWPANVVTDGSDEVVGCFPVTAAAKATARGLQGRHDVSSPETANIKDYSNSVRGHSDAGGSAARFYYSAKASKADRNGSKHPTVKPIALMQWLARLITPPGGTILDPFAGSGTTGAAAALEGFNCVMVEREAEYVADIVRRLQI